jgi:ankyrin repeat protein
MNSQEVLMNFSQKELYIPTLDLYGNTPIHTYVINGRVGALDKYVELSSANIRKIINTRNVNGQTPLHMAKNPEIIKILLKNHASPFIPDNNNNLAYTGMVKKLFDETL